MKLDSEGNIQTQLFITSAEEPVYKRRNIYFYNSVLRVIFLVVSTQVSGPRILCITGEESEK